MLNRAKIALSGEQGGPSVETIIGIAVAIIMGIALISFGNMVVKKTQQAEGQINNLATNGDLGFGITTPTTKGTKG